MQNRDRHPTDALFPMLYGCRASLVTALFLITAFTLAACNSSNPTSLIDPLSCAALLISSLTGGFFAAHSRKGASSPLPEVITGAGSSIMLIAVTLILGAVPISSTVERSTGKNTLLILAVAILGAVGGIIGRRRNSARHRRKRIGKRRI